MEKDVYSYLIVFKGRIKNKGYDFVIIRVKIGFLF